MTKEEADDILKDCKEIKNNNLKDAFRKRFPSADLESVLVEDFTANDLANLGNKVLNSFLFVLSDPAEYVFLKKTNDQSESLKSSILRYKRSISDVDFNQAAYALEVLVRYQKKNGIYDTNFSESKGSVSEEKAKSLLQKVSAIDITVRRQHRELQEKVLQFEEYVKQKHDELNTISSSVDSTNKLREQITATVTEVATHAASIKSTFSQISEQLPVVVKDAVAIGDYKRETEKLLGVVSEKAVHELRNIEDLKTSFSATKVFLEDKQEFFEEKISYMDAIIGNGVGINLFQTFKQRKEELAPRVLWWQWAVPCMALVTIVWIFFIFKVVDATNSWEMLAINTIKSVPAVFILLFTINQYRKERNFQEEYAFKSAVALTVDAYSKTITDPINRDKLILDAVLSIFKTPIEEKQSDKVKTKTALEVVKAMADTTKELVKGK